MKLHKILLTPPIVAISAALFCGALFGEVNDYTGATNGSWHEDGNWSLGHEPQADEDVTISGSKTVNVTNAVTVASLTLASKAVLSVTAQPLENTSSFAVSQDAAAAALWANRLVFKVIGALSVPSGCTVMPYNDKLTGTPVAFEVGSADIAGTIDATGAGWGWTALGDKTLPAGAFKQRKSANDPWYYAFAFGTVHEETSTTFYDRGTSHGGKGSGTSGAVYGYAAAPFMPGSPAALYSAKYDTRGGGSVIIHATGTINLSGTIKAIGNRNGQNAGTSGGSVWLAAKSIVRSDTSLINANGEAGLNGNQGQGSGGRVALTYGASAAELAELATGIVPETITVTDLVADNVTVKGGSYGTTFAKDGTKTEGLSANLRTKITVRSDAGFDLTAEGVTWGDNVVDVGSNYEFTAPEYGFAAADPSNVRKAFTGYVISNRTAEVERKAERSLVFSPVAGEGPYTLTWLMGPREVRTAVSYIGDGAGTVTEEGVAHEADFEVWKTDEKTVTLTAVAAQGSVFVEFVSAEFAGGFTTEPEVTLSAGRPHAMEVYFASGNVKRAWVGPKNGNVMEPTNWSPAGVPTSQDELYFTNATVTVTGAWAVKKLVVAGKSSVTFQAVTAAGTNPVSFDEIYAGATVVQIADDFEISDTATVTAANDPKTGVAVRFEVGGDFSVAEGATFTADGKGWYWYAGNDDPARTKVQGSAEKGYWQTRAPGAGGDGKSDAAYSRGGGYGGAGGGSNGDWGKTYGYAAAPFLPGSPNGMYGWVANRAMHPGGTLWVRCAGTVTVEGKVTTDGEKKDTFGDGSGGGIWLLAQDFVFGAQALLSAHGGDSTGNSYGNAGGGGRIALGLGLSDGEIAALASGAEDVSGIRIYNKIPVVETVLRPGLHLNGSGNGGSSGTARLVVGADCAPVAVDGAPLRAVGTLPRYGIYGHADGETVTLTAEAYGYDPADDSVRYAFDGYVVSNTTEQVDEDVKRSVELTAGLELKKLTWKWGAPQPTAVILMPEHATMTVNGVAVTDDTVIWVEPGVLTEVTVTPEAGYEFLNWTGDVPFGVEPDNPVAFAFTKSSTVTPVLRLAEEPTTRTWGGGTGSWNDPEAWTPKGNIPGPKDDVVVGDGTCNVPNYLAAKSLTVSGGTLNAGADAANSARIVVSDDVTLAGGTVKFGVANLAGHVKADIGGDLALSGSAKLYVYGGVIEGEYTHATGASWLNVGGTLALEDTSTLYPVSSAYTGGSVKMTATAFTLAEGATVNADQAGFTWLDTETPPLTIGKGQEYDIGAGHGVSVGNAQPNYGHEYGFKNSPVMPGSPSGVWGSAWSRGGGLIRIHARAMTVLGTLTANARLDSTSGGASGGGIWLTADSYAFGTAAKLLARGGASGNTEHHYGSVGAGGRIAIGYRLTDEQISSLAETGTWAGLRPKSRRLKTLEQFRSRIGNADMEVDLTSVLRYPEDQTSRTGTFCFVDEPDGLMLLVK